MDLPESCLSTVKFSGSPPTNTPVFSPMMVLPLEAEALPDGKDEGITVHIHVAEQRKKGVERSTRVHLRGNTT